MLVKCLVSMMGAWKHTVNDSFFLKKKKILIHNNKTTKKLFNPLAQEQIKGAIQLSFSLMLIQPWMPAERLRTSMSANPLNFSPRARQGWQSWAWTAGRKLGSVESAAPNQGYGWPQGNQKRQRESSPATKGSGHQNKQGTRQRCYWLLPTGSKQVTGTDTTPG